jgi:uncharacterized protein (DUF433 family)
MKKTRKQKLAMYSMVPVTMSLMAVGFASADTGTTTSVQKFGNKVKGGIMHKGPMNPTGDTALAQALGMSSADLKTALSSGKTIDTLITEKGLNKTTVMQALRTAHEAEMQTRIQADIASGKLTQAQADQMKADHAAREEKQKQALANALGISVASLDADMTAGKTMDQLATEHGLTADALKTKLDASRDAQMKADLAERVVSGKLTQAQADSILANKGQGGHHKGERGAKGPQDLGL